MSQKRYELPLPMRRVAAGEMKVLRRAASDKRFNPGRRAEIRYQDLGLQEATGDELRAEIMHIGNTGPSRPTDWHYHTVCTQFLHVIRGWVRMQFPGEDAIVLEEGDSITIPGGVVHRELAASDALELLEITMPGRLSTVTVEAGDWDPETARAK